MTLAGAQLSEPGGGEVAVEGERFEQAHRAHRLEARRVDERVLALVVAAQPAQRIELGILGDRDEAQARGGGVFVVPGKRARGGVRDETGAEEGLEGVESVAKALGGDVS